MDTNPEVTVKPPLQTCSKPQGLYIRVHLPQKSERKDQDIDILYGSIIAMVLFLDRQWLERSIC
jgi:hypothetical protein